MKYALPLFVAAIVAFALISPPADGASVWSATVDTTMGDGGVDGGVTGTGVLTANGTFTLECDAPACFKTSVSGTVLPDCAKDTVLAAVRVINTSEVTAAGGGTGTQTEVAADFRFRATFESSNHLRVAAKSLGGGAISCKILSERFNVKRFP